MEEKDTKRMKIIATILRVIAIISRVAIYIAAVTLLLCAIAIPKTFKKIKLEKDLIEYKGDNKKDSFKLYREDGKLMFSYNDKEHNLEKDLDATELTMVNGLVDVLNDTTKGAVIAYLEIICILGFVTLVLFAEGIRKIEKVLKNIKERDKVFELENAENIKKAAIIYCALFIVSLVLSVFIGKVFNTDGSTSFNFIGVGEILVLFLVYYIFLYGSKLEEAKETISKPAKKPRATKKKKEE